MKFPKLPDRKPPPPPDVSPPMEPDPTPDPAPRVGKPAQTEKKMSKALEKANAPEAREKAAKTKKDNRAIGQALRKMLQMKPLEFEQTLADPGLTQAEKVASSILVKAGSGTMEAIKIVLDRTEGRVPQALEVNNSSHKNVEDRVSEISRDRLNDIALGHAAGAEENDGQQQPITDGTGGGAQPAADSA